MKFRTTLIALAIASSAAIAPTAFAQSADLSITGRIFPGACVIELGNDGVVDLGDIRADSLNAHSTTILEPVHLPVTVACESQVRFALQGTDNTENTSPSSFDYGLGLTPADEKIGGASFRLSDVSADAGAAYFTRSYNNGQNWTTASTGGDYSIGRKDLVGFAKAQGVTTGPSPIESLQAVLRVGAYIQPASGLTLTDEILINGSATINVLYL
jgi:type 1 fimbria pilin